MVWPGERERALLGETWAGGGRLVRPQEDGVLGAGRAAEPGEGSGAAPPRLAGVGAGAARGARPAGSRRPRVLEAGDPRLRFPSGPRPSPGPPRPAPTPVTPLSAHSGVGVSAAASGPRFPPGGPEEPAGPRRGGWRAPARSSAHRWEGPPEESWEARWYPAVPRGEGQDDFHSLRLSPSSASISVFGHLGASLTKLEGRSGDFFPLSALVESGRTVNSRRHRAVR